MPAVFGKSCRAFIKLHYLAIVGLQGFPCVWRMFSGSGYLLKRVLQTYSVVTGYWEGDTWDAPQCLGSYRVESRGLVEDRMFEW